ncbi:uncharacterized protein A4U43_C03F25350 [Asparagus officinalis]|uniref:Uncharacterized protein n=1 Tax=Asparagus officinalis TaxID=4686 RepID=A0A5P1FCY0_ASPOF|nr:uncharacterized protein A4U43_C03F25350 [Asparagus officinalis]
MFFPTNFLCWWIDHNGRLLRTLADVATEGGFLSMEQVLYNALCFGVAVAATAAFTIYSKRALQTLKAGEGFMCWNELSARLVPSISFGK